MEQNEIKGYKLLLDALIDHQSTLFDQGHTFWHCDMHDKDERTGETIPFRYYQTNRTVHMSTCSTCYKLLDLRKQIRQVEKLLGMPQTPIHTRFTTSDNIKRMSVNSASEWNPNYSYLS